MVCRNPGRAQEARSEIVSRSGNQDVHVLLADTSLETDIRRLVQDFQSHRKQALAEVGQPEAAVSLDGLVCNAGGLDNQRKLTAEGLEVTFAAHLLFGTYLLGKLLMPCLELAQGRFVAVSSGGMYN